MKKTEHEEHNCSRGKAVEYHAPPDSGQWPPGSDDVKFASDKAVREMAEYFGRDNSHNPIISDALAEGFQHGFQAAEKLGEQHVENFKNIARNTEIERYALETKLAEKAAEIAEQCRLNGMGQERELKLISQLTEKDAEIERLKAERETWGNEFNAVIIVKDKLTAAESLVEKLEGVVNIEVSCWCHEDGTSVNCPRHKALAAIEAWRSGKEQG